MNESASMLTDDLRTIAADLKELNCWGALPLEQLLTQMKDGGAPGTEAWITVLKHCVLQPTPVRQRAELLISRFQQTVGRLIIAETKDRMSRHPYPPKD